MDYKSAAATGLAAYGIESVVFGSDSHTAMKDGAQMALSSVGSSYVADSLVSILPSSLTHMVGSIGTAAIYMGIDQYTQLSPINSMAGKFVFAVGAATLGDALVGIVDNGLGY